MPLKETLQAFLFLRQIEERLYCKIEQALRLAWADSALDLSEALATLAGNRSLTKVEYQMMRAQAEMARLASENARLALELHRQEHDC